MAKPELGTKRVCVSCGARFYDLTRVPATCPKCGTVQPVEQPRNRRPTGGNVVEEKRPKAAPAPSEDADAEVESGDEEAGEDVLEDTSDLEDDDAGLGGDIEVEPERDDNER